MSFITARRAQMNEEKDFLAETLLSFYLGGLDALASIPGLTEQVEALADKMAPSLAAADAVARASAAARRARLPLLRRYMEGLKDAIEPGFKARTDAELAIYFKAALRGRADEVGKNKAHEVLGEAYPWFMHATLDLIEDATRGYWSRQCREYKKAGRPTGALRDAVRTSANPHR